MLVTLVWVLLLCLWACQGPVMWPRAQTLFWSLQQDKSYFVDCLKFSKTSKSTKPSTFIRRWPELAQPLVGWILLTKRVVGARRDGSWLESQQAHLGLKWETCQISRRSRPGLHFLVFILFFHLNFPYSWQYKESYLERKLIVTGRDELLSGAACFLSTGKSSPPPPLRKSHPPPCPAPPHIHIPSFSFPGFIFTSVYNLDIFHLL